MFDYEEMKMIGIFKKKCLEEYYVVFCVFCEDLQVNLLKIFLGKIEIYFE